MSSVLRRRGGGAAALPGPASNPTLALANLGTAWDAASGGATWRLPPLATGVVPVYATAILRGSTVLAAGVLRTSADDGQTMRRRDRVTVAGVTYEALSAPLNVPAGQVGQARPFRLAVFGDSFGQRSQDILGAPNAIDAGAVDPQTAKWATDATNRRGGVQWGFASHLSLIGRGRYVTPWQLIRAIGGFNTGQLSRFQAPDPSPFYLADFLAYLASLPTGSPLRPDGIVLQAGTNDDAGGFSAAQSYGNLLAICQRLVAAAYPVFLSTILPRGTAAVPLMRVADVARVDDLNNRLVGASGYAGLAAEPTLNGMVRVVDPRAQFRDLSGGAAPNDVLPALVYDGLHLSAEGCRRLAAAYRTALDAYWPQTVLAPDPGGMIANGFMAGTSGTVTRSGNAATNTGFAVSGTAPDGWRVGTEPAAFGNGGISLPGMPTGWSGTDPANVKGTLVASIEAASAGQALVVALDCSSSGVNTNVRAAYAACAVTLTSDVAVGDYFQGFAFVEVARRAGLPIAGFMGINAELRVTDPDGTLRVDRSSGQAPNGTANMAWGDNEFVGADGLWVYTPPTLRKAGTYGAIELAIQILVAGGVPDIDVVVRISRAGVRRALGA